MSRVLELARRAPDPLLRRGDRKQVHLVDGIYGLFP